ncbi:MAG: ABC transporter ATP-binding protein [Planctomycetota bacterium]
MQKTSEQIILMQNIDFAYDGRAVLSDVSFSADEGDFIGVVGPNGSGKTTLIKLLSRVLKPRSGRIEIAGEDISRIPNRRLARIAAVVPQETNVLFAYTVAEIVLMGRYPYLGALSFERGEDVAVAQEAMETTDVAQFADRLISQVSGGEKQRVVIARALAQEPRIMLLDEPTAFLDLKHQVGIYSVLQKLNREKRMTILAVSHSLNLAAQFCRRIIMLDKGRIAADGTPGEVLTGENIERVFEVKVRITRDESTGAPQVTPDAGRNVS